MAAKKKYNQIVLISHTHSEKDRNLQLSDLRYYFHIRGGDIEKVDVRFLDDSKTTPERRKAIQKWVDSHRTASVYRNGILTPCADIATKKPGVVKTKEVEPKEKGGDA